MLQGLYTAPFPIQFKTSLPIETDRTFYSQENSKKHRLDEPRTSTEDKENPNESEMQLHVYKQRTLTSLKSTSKIRRRTFWRSSSGPSLASRNSAVPRRRRETEPKAPQTNNSPRWWRCRRHPWRCLRQPDMGVEIELTYDWLSCEKRNNLDSSLSCQWILHFCQKLISILPHSIR